MTDKPNETVMQFPCEFTLKLFGLTGPEFEVTALTIVRKHVPDLAEQALVIRPSSNGKYSSLSISFTAHSKEQLDNLYRELSASPQILMAL